MSEAEIRIGQVHEGELHHTSVSGIQLFRMCKRRWNYREVQGLPDDPGKAAEFGTRGHERIEIFLTTGQDILSPLERLGVQRGLIPAPGKDLLVEHRFKGPDALTLDGIPLHGFIDLINPRTLDTLGVLTVADWKFKGDLRWASKKEDFTDPDKDSGIQMLAYAEYIRRNLHTFQWGDKVKTLRLQHGTFQRPPKPRDCKPTEADLALESVPELWQRVLPHVQGMRDVARETDPHKVEATEGDNTCFAFRKECAYAKHCKQGKSRVMGLFKLHSERNKKAAGALQETQMGMMDRYKKTATAAAQGTVALPQTPAMEPAATVAPVTPPVVAAAPKAPTVPKIVIIDESTTPDPVFVKKAVQGRRYEIEGKIYTFIAHTPINGVSKGSFSPEGGGTPFLLDLNVGVYEAAPSTAAVQIKPPDSPPSKPELASRPVETPPVAPAQPQETPPVAPAAATEKPKAKRGRPAKDPEAKAAPAVQEDGTDSADLALDGIRIFVGCTPIGVALTSLGAYADSIERLILDDAQQTGCPDIRAVNTQELSFGKWRGIVAKLAQAQPPKPGDYYAGQGDERVDVIMQALIQVLPAGSVVVGK